jgi:uncharacterized membrane protein YqgA involved in biofilm formation
MTGTLLNVITVLIGTALGVALGNRLPERMRETVLAGLGLTTIGYAVLNIVDAMSNQQNVPLKFIVVMLALLFGGIAGELINIDGALHRFGAFLERRFNRSAGGDGESTARFIRGFITASLVFCVGPMTILGSIQDGLSGDYGLLAIKSTLDGFAALAFAASLGIGVGFSIITIIVIQGGIALLAGLLQGVFTPPMLAVLSATGALLIIGIGLTLLDLKKIRLANFLPALVIGPLFVAVLAALNVNGFR